MKFSVGSRDGFGKVSAWKWRQAPFSLTSWEPLL
jgi:hypothetical protein